MEIQTKPIFKIRTPRVKCVTGHKDYPNILVCLFTGEIQLYDCKTLSLKKAIQVCEVPIRTAAIVPTKDWILLGNDEGNLLVLDLGNLTILDTIKAHDDFIRKIIVDENNKRLITVSDDNRTKLWSISDGIVQVSKYKDSKHFVMDACFSTSDPSNFFTVSLDCKVRMYTVTSTSMIKAFKGHEKGINSIAFMGPDAFITGSDDTRVILWDTKRTHPVAVLTGHTKNVTKVYALNNGFASCSEDNTVRIWNSELKTTDILNLQGRVWDMYVKDGRVFVGSDEELCVFQEVQATINAVMRDGRIFYNQGQIIYVVKGEEIGAFKELGTVENPIETLAVNANGKLVAIMGGMGVAVFSILGMRKKYSDRGKDLVFIDADRFVYVKDSTIVMTAGNKFECTKEVPDLQRLLFANCEQLVLNTGKGTAVHSLEEPSTPVHQFGITVQKATIHSGHFVLFSDRIHVFDSKFEAVNVFDHRIESFVISDDVLYFSTQNRSFYMMIGNGSAYLYPLKFYGSLIGVSGGVIYYYINGIKSDCLDSELIHFKKDFFKGLAPVPSEALRDKAISFFESLGLHEKALELCQDANQRFEILIKLNRLEDALGAANSPIKHEKLGRKFLGLGEFEKAADCFRHTWNLGSLFLTDLFGSRKYLGYVTQAAKESGNNNLALLAAYKNKDYEMCSFLLRDTQFGKVFEKFYISNN